VRQRVFDHEEIVDDACPGAGSSGVLASTPFLLAPATAEKALSRRVGGLDLPGAAPITAQHRQRLQAGCGSSDAFRHCLLDPKAWLKVAVAVAARSADFDD
jgi:hypothetical protein